MLSRLRSGVCCSQLEITYSNLPAGSARHEKRGERRGEVSDSRIKARELSASCIDYNQWPSLR